MIDVRDLRIGNYVQLYRHGEDSKMSIHKINDIFRYKGEVEYNVSFEDNFYCNLSGIEPILLTPEILEKCGFEHGMCYYKNDIELTAKDWDKEFNENNPLFFTINCNEYNVSDNPILYLHQLQNLYYAINQKELEVKL